MHTEYRLGPIEPVRNADGQLVGWEREEHEVTYGGKPPFDQAVEVEDGEEDDWDEFDLITECDHCGKKRPCIRRFDPFIAEVYPEDLDEAEETYWCYDCFCDRKDKI